MTPRRVLDIWSRILPYGARRPSCWPFDGNQEVRPVALGLGALALAKVAVVIAGCVQGNCTDSDHSSITETRLEWAYKMLWAAFICMILLCILPTVCRVNTLCEEGPLKTLYRRRDREHKTFSASVEEGVFTLLFVGTIGIGVLLTLAGCFWDSPLLQACPSNFTAHILVIVRMHVF